MTLEEFNNLNQRRRIKYLELNGCFIEERVIYTKFIYKLYSISSFYVEVEHAITSHEILSIVAYKPIDIADSYLRRRDLDYALNEKT